MVVHGNVKKKARALVLCVCFFVFFFVFFVFFFVLKARYYDFLEIFGNLDAWHGTRGFIAPTSFRASLLAGALYHTFSPRLTF